MQGTDKDLSGILMRKPVRPWTGDIGHKKGSEAGSKFYCRIWASASGGVGFPLTKMEGRRASRSWGAGWQVMIRTEKCIRHPHTRVLEQQVGWVCAARRTWTSAAYKGPKR